MKDGGGGWACDYCGEAAAAAALHYRVDATRLCVDVAFSRKHVRSPLCSSRPAAARLAPNSNSSGEPSFFCSDCNESDQSAASVRVPVEGFSGCPSAAELTASWGLDLCLPGDGAGDADADEDDPFFSALDYSMLVVDPVMRDLYVPCDPPEIVGGGGRRLKGKRWPTS